MNVTLNDFASIEAVGVFSNFTVIIIVLLSPGAITKSVGFYQTAEISNTEELISVFVTTGVERVASNSEPA